MLRAMWTARSAAVLAAALASLALLVAAAACRDGASSRQAASDAAALRHYAVRGEIVKLPAPGTAEPQVMIRHEPIDDFADQSGKIVGMGAMTMPFDVGPGVSLEALRPGDKVEATLAVGWSPAVLRIERLRKLPADTVLRTGPAHPGAPRPP
jgi:Cu/Ag efflux protein CusF